MSKVKTRVVDIQEDGVIRNEDGYIIARLVDGKLEVEDLSVDHKPTNESEKSRIEKAGGEVDEDGRVLGNLGCARSIGDLFYKSNKSLTSFEQFISNEPDIKRVPLDKTIKYLIVGCDGIWDCMSSQ